MRQKPQGIFPPNMEARIWGYVDLGKDECPLSLRNSQRWHPRICGNVRVESCAYQDVSEQHWKLAGRDCGPVPESDVQHSDRCHGACDRCDSFQRETEKWIRPSEV